MRDGYCMTKRFNAPSGGEIICTRTNVNFERVNDYNLLPGDRCRVTCEAAHAIPEYISCEYNGWNHKDTGNSSLRRGCRILRH
jgi:hypothetical protein